MLPKSYSGGEGEGGPEGCIPGDSRVHAAARCSAGGPPSGLLELYRLYRGPTQGRGRAGDPSNHGWWFRRHSAS